MTENNKVSVGTLLSLFGIALLAFAGILSETSMNVTFSHLKTVFQMDLGVLQWITTGYLLAMSISITLGATLSHNFKERRIIFSSLLIFAVGNAVAMIAGNFAILMIGRILQGLAAGVAIPLLFNLIVERIPKSKIGLYMGLCGLVISLAPAFGPTYGGIMITHFDWHMIFIFIFPVPIISFILTYFFLEDSKTKEKRPFDLLSFILLSIALTASLIVISSLEEKTNFNWLALFIFLVSFVGFIYKSLRSKHPLLDLRILKDPIVILGLVPFFTYQFVNLSINFLLPNFLVIVKESSSSLAGFALLPGTLLGAILAPFLGRLYDTKGPKLSLYGGNLIITLSLLCFIILTPYLGIGLVIGIYIFFTIGRNMAFNNTLALSASLIERQKSPDLTAIFQMAQTFAGAIGTAVAAVLVNQAPDTSTGANWVFILLGTILMCNFIYFYFLFKSIAKK